MNPTQETTYLYVIMVIMASSSVVGELKEEFVKFLESSIKFYVSLVEQLQLKEESPTNSHSKRKVMICTCLCYF